MRTTCPRCRTSFDAVAGSLAACPDCGLEFMARPAKEDFGDFQPVHPPPARPAPAPAPVHHAPRKKRRVTRERIAYGLAVNIVVPGAGTLMADRRAEGSGQLLLFAVGLLTIPLLVGLALAPAAWVWALVSSIQHLVEFDRGTHAKRH